MIATLSRILVVLAWGACALGAAAQPLEIEGVKLEPTVQLGGSTLSVKQAIFRYLGYFVALLPLGLGILWVAFDKRKQGWQDKLAGSVVLRDDS